MTDHHRQRAEAIIEDTGSSAEQALHSIAYSLIALTDELAGLRALLMDVHGYEDEQPVDATAAEIVPDPAPITPVSLVDGPVPLAQLNEDAVIALADYPGKGWGEPMQKACEVCSAPPGEPCRPPSWSPGAGFYAAGYVHRFRLDGIPF